MKEHDEQVVIDAAIAEKELVQALEVRRTLFTFSMCFQHDLQKYLVKTNFKNFPLFNFSLTSSTNTVRRNGVFVMHVSLRGLF